MRNITRFGIRPVLLSVTACLGILAIASLGYQVAASVNRYRSAVALDQANAASNHLVAGIYKVLLERLATNNALQADAPAIADTRDRIESLRKSLNDDFAAGLPVILATDFPNKAVLTDALHAAEETAASLRKRATEAIAHARSERDSDLLKSFVPGMTEYVNASLRVLTAALYAAKDGDPMFARYATLKQLGWMLREVSGLERALISTAIASTKPIPAEGIQQITGYRAQIAMAWKMVQDLTADPETDPLLRQALAGAKERYF